MWSGRLLLVTTATYHSVHQESLVGLEAVECGPSVSNIRDASGKVCSRARGAAAFCIYVTHIREGRNTFNGPTFNLIMLLPQVNVPHAGSDHMMAAYVLNSACPMIEPMYRPVMREILPPCLPPDFLRMPYSVFPGLHSPP